MKTPNVSRFTDKLYRWLEEFRDGSLATGDLVELIVLLVSDRDSKRVLNAFIQSGKSSMPFTDGEVADLCGSLIFRLQTRYDVAGEHFSISRGFGGELIVMLQECARRLREHEAAGTPRDGVTGRRDGQS